MVGGAAGCGRDGPLGELDGRPGSRRQTYPTRRVDVMSYALVGSTAGSIAGPALGGVLFDLGDIRPPSP